MERRTPSRRDVALAGLLVLASQVEVWIVGVDAGQSVGVALFQAAAAALLAWRRVAPLAVAVGVVAVEVVGSVFGPPFSWTLLVVTLVAFYSVGAMHDRRRSVAGLLFGIAVGIPMDIDGTLNTYLAVVMTSFVVPWTVGALAWRQRRIAEVEYAAGHASKAAVAAERARLAREIHDVVSHSIGMIVVQAAAADILLDDQPERSRGALREIEHGARHALVELRQMLTLLQPDGHGDLAPSPRLDGLPDLVSRVRSAGVPVELDVRGEPREVDPTVDLAAYRVIQEGLTNALKHAGPCTASVTVNYDRELHVRVRDSGRGMNGLTRSGFGLAGLEGRVRDVGGTLSTTNLDPNGFELAARLPLTEPVL